MFCPRCGAPTIEGANFCEKCGFNLASLDQPTGAPKGASAAAPTPSQQGAQAQQTPQPSAQQGYQTAEPQMQQAQQAAQQQAPEQGPAMQQGPVMQQFSQPQGESFFGTMFANYKFIMTQQYANFSGRLSRAHYWQFQIAMILVTLVITIIGLIISDSFGDTVMVLAMVAHLIPSLGTTVRRLHDRDMCGWWILLQFIPTIGSLILLILLLMAGDKWVNRYGPVPGPLRQG